MGLIYFFSFILFFVPEGLNVGNKYPSRNSLLPQRGNTFHPLIDALLVEGDVRWAKYGGMEKILDEVFDEINLRPPLIGLGLLEESNQFSPDSLFSNSVI